MPELLVLGGSVSLTLLFRMVLPASFQSNENSDYIAFYEPVAQNFLNGRGFTSAGGSPYIRYPPGFSILLAGVFKASHFFGVSEEQMLAAFILACTGTASLFLFLLARRVWGPDLALVSSLVWITYPPLLWLTKQPNSEMPFLVFLYAGVFIFWHVLTHERTMIMAFLSGTFVGFSMLIRPISIGVGFVMSLAFYVLAKEMTVTSRLLFIAAIFLGNVVTVCPWEAWVYAKTGKIIILSSGSIESVHDGLTFAGGSDYRKRIDVDQDIKDLMKRIHAAYSSKKEIKSLHDILSIVIDELVTQPLVVVKLYVLKSVRAWYGTESGRFENGLLFMQSAYLAVAVIGTLAVWNLNADARKVAVLVWLIVVYFWLMTIMVLSIARYMVPAMGLLTLLAPGYLCKIRFANLQIQTECKPSLNR